MSGGIYHCADERRRALIAAPAAPPGLSGVDYVTVDVGPPLRLLVELVKPVHIPAADLTDATVQITGGVRFAAPAGTVTREPANGPAQRIVVTFPLDASIDFSTYLLRLVKGADDPSPPDFIDPRLAEVAFSFKVDCPSDFDCAPACPAPEALPPDPTFDYRARDYQGFRRLMMDRLAALVPDLGGDVAADLTTTLVEALAYDADQMSYRLDWVGTEAFLGTARSPASLRRLARLVDYTVGEGASARTFVQIAVTPGVGAAADGMLLPAGTPLLPRMAGLPAMISADDYRAVLQAGAPVFESVWDISLWAWRNEIAFHTWGDDLCGLCKGATSATLVDASVGAGPLAAGDLLLLAEVRSPQTGLPADARRDRRQVVRLTDVTPAIDPLAPGVSLVTVAWAAQDALRFDLTCQAMAPDAPAGSPGIICAVARGNVLLADHGASLPPAAALGLPSSDVAALSPALSPSVSSSDVVWRPVIDLPAGIGAGIARIAVPAANGPAIALMQVDPIGAIPALRLQDDFQSWSARIDLIASGPFARDFVVETGIDGRPLLRFGDGVYGLAPAAGASLGVAGRFGFGVAGNLGADSIAHVVTPAALGTARLLPTNPTPAVGGADREPAALIRARAPEAFRRQDRAVTVDDYAAIARRHEEVADATAVLAWTGSWWTVLVYVDRVAGALVDGPFRARLAAFLEAYRTMGFDVAVLAARPASLDIALEICAAPGLVRGVVAQRVRGLLQPVRPDGRPGFFNPDRFRFGTPLYLSALTEAVMATPGVTSMRVLTFKRWAKAQRGELAAGVIRPEPLEILRLDDDASLPENGRLTLTVGGGQ